MAKKRIYEVAKELGVSTEEMIAQLHEVGLEEITSSLNTLDEEAYHLIIDLFGGIETVDEAQTETKTKTKVKVPEPEREGEPRPPVVAVLGHIDHGKTTLLSTIKQTDMTAGEAGGITQAIGAYQIAYNGKQITFIDTPGHEAFTRMRARGAQVTDIAVLVVAADEGVMTQTKEAINHIRAADVPVIVVINKIDKRNADLDRVMNQLTQEELTPEDWGGETITIPISALTGENIEELLEMILLVAELEDLRADPGKKAVGTVIEGSLDPTRGPIASVIVKEGTLEERDILLAGTAYGRIRALLNDQRDRVKRVLPGIPVEILGLSDVPSAGVPFAVIESLSEAKRIANARQQEQRSQRLRESRKSVEELFEAAMGEKLDLVVKADTAGSLEALEGELSQLEVQEVNLEFIHRGVGPITESDILLASASQNRSAVIGYRIGVDRNAESRAKQERVTLQVYEVIYELTDAIERVMVGLVQPKYVEEKIGEVEVRHLFNIPGVGVVVGCYVSDGVVQRNAGVRVLRDGEMIFEGTIASLKRYEENVRQVASGRECGIRIGDFDDIKVGDQLEIYTVTEVKG
ncbi:MAG: translation initiation factor IF-2 [Candidatus Bipolaricaulia bacterium]